VTTRLMAGCAQKRKAAARIAIAAAGLMIASVSLSAAALEPTLDRAAWGSNHVGRLLPEFISGDECLFCHRVSIGPAWTKNRHQSTVRLVEFDPSARQGLKSSKLPESLIKEVEFALGRTNQWRWLKRSEAYGHLDLLSARTDPAGSAAKPPSEHVAPHWDTRAFAARCAGCHATGVDSRTGAFAATSIDCFACHGDASLEHTKDTSGILLARKRNDPARVVASICGSCHIRSGRSRSTGRPFPNNFVPGDNLFQDFAVNFSNAAIGKLNPIDRHVLLNVRDMVEHGRQEVTCLSCHSVHRSSTAGHQRQPRGEICWTCHDRERETLLPNGSKTLGTVCDE